MKRITALATLAVLTSMANADIIYFNSTQVLDGSENVVFNVPGLTSTGTLVQGQLNESGHVYDFLSTESLTTVTLSGTKIEASDGAFTLLDIRPNTGVESFTGINFDINAAADGNLLISVTKGTGEVEDFDLFDVFGAGSNPFTIQATAGDVITRVVLSTSSAFTDVRSFRVAGSVEAVPEPSSMAALATGGLLLLRKRTRKFF